MRTEVAFIKGVLGLLIKCLEVVSPLLGYEVILKNRQVVSKTSLLLTLLLRTRSRYLSVVAMAT